MDFNMKYNIFAEAKAVLNMTSPLATFRPGDIGTFVLAWSSEDTTTSIRGTLMGFGCDELGEYAMVKPWTSDTVVRYKLVAPLPPDLMPTKSRQIGETVWRNPEVKQPGMPL